MSIQPKTSLGGLAGGRLARPVFCGLLLLTLAMLAGGCEITDPDWQQRGNISTLQPTSPPPPHQWRFW